MIYVKLGLQREASYKAVTKGVSFASPGLPFCHANNPSKWEQLIMRPIAFHVNDGI